MKLEYLQRPTGLNSRLFNYALRRISKSFTSYHPISLQGRPLQAGQRNCLDRWTMIATAMQTHVATSLLDLGCAEGYFVRRAAQEFNCFALGIDADISRLLVGQTCVLLDRVERAGFTLADIDANLLQTHAATSLLDLGCAEGYFVRRAAQEFNCFALGIDADISRLLVAQNCVLLDRVERAGFTLADIDTNLLQTLPSFDAVLFLSVMHHVMYEHGLDHARQLLMAIRTKTRKFLIFDMGHSNETRNEWAKLLPDMGSDPTAWIAEFLRSAGFTEVQKLGETDSYRNDASRSVFLARP